jgi:DNA polymerase-3 subunit alpha
MPRFCHVHNHTEYSLLDGANRIPEMVKRAKELGMDALSISDHGVMFGAMEFYLECQYAGIKPIIGLEAYVAPKGMLRKSGREENETYHLLLLAKDLEGYRNLCKLSTIAALEGYYYKPRIDHDLLRKYSKGLIGTSACLGSEVCQNLLKGEYDKAQHLAGMYSEIFGEGNYFIELQDHGLPEQHAIYEPLKRIAKELKLPLIATNDAHYLCKADSRPHDVLLCIQTGALVADEKRMRFQTDEFYLKSPEEMSALFPNDQEAIENTIRVQDMCNVELGKQRALMPHPDLPNGMTSQSFLRHLSENGLKDRIPGADDQAYERLNYEISVIEKTGFEDYFLLVREFANATREKGIFFGVRGSAAGSLVSYCLGITDVDPLEYDLTFERFLNPERVSMPDIDMDFEDARRDEIIQYVTQKYGSDHVAQIITFGTLGAKAAIKDCGRVLGYSPQETDKLCKTIPTLPGWSIERAYKEIVEFREIVDSDPRMQSLVDVSKSVEGISRHAGVHAAGVVIAREPLVDFIPLYRGNDGQPVTAFEMGILEKIGLLKMDFLGLSNLTVLARTVENIKRTHGTHLDIRALPLDDVKTYEMLGKGDTTGVFQLEGGGMTRYVQQLKPQSVRELAAMVALYRPGPMDHIPKFIDTKHGRLAPTFLDERMRPLLEETYGVIVYQDQVLKLVQALAGFSLGKADLLRRAMGKKDVKAMKEMKAEFLSGAKANEVVEDTANKVWDLLLPFAGYAFNKAHAVCYALLAYQTAYLKANYPIEYMAGLLSVYRSREDRVTTFIEECRRQKIPVLPPDVNESEVDFSIVMDVQPSRTNGKPKKAGAKSTSNDSAQGCIRFGLAAIKNVGDGVVEAIIKERDENGRFTHLYEFAERIRPHGLNRSALESLVKAGAFDAIDHNRNKLLEVVEAALSYADSMSRNKAAGQGALFEGDGNGHAHSYPILPDFALPSKSDQLAMEKDVLGIYVSDHPLRGFERAVATQASHECQNVQELDEGTYVKLAGVIAGLKQIVTKSKGERMASLVLEDLGGQATVIAFPATFAKVRDNLVKDRVVQVTGYIMHRDRPGNGGDKTIEVRLEDVQPLEPTLDLQINQLPDIGGLVTLKIFRATEKQLGSLKGVLERNQGGYEVFIQIMPDDTHQPFFVPYRIEPSDEVLHQIKGSVGRCDIKVIHPRNLGPTDHEAA